MTKYFQFSAVKEAGFNPVLEYAGDDASLHSDPGKTGSTGTAPGVQVPSSMASDEVQPLWTAQLRASLTQIYEKCSVQIPTPLQRPSHIRPLLDLEAATAAATSATASAGPTANKSETGPLSSESDLSNNLA